MRQRSRSRSRSQVRVVLSSFSYVSREVPLYTTFTFYSLFILLAPELIFSLFFVSLIAPPLFAAVAIACVTATSADGSPRSLRQNLKNYEAGTTRSRPLICLPFADRVRAP